MNSSWLRNSSIYVLGTTCILLGATATASQATGLVGFSTYGDMMSGMRVTTSFVNGTSETSLWQKTSYGSGGSFGSNWYLAQTGNTYNSPWTFSNANMGITSVVINAIPGNTLFDNYPYFEGPLQTPGSAEGWNFQTIFGQSPDFYRYSDPIDISHGDLFGTLSLYWTNGFTGTMQFLADTDSGSKNDPVKPRDPGVVNAVPTAYFTAPTIYEGQWATTSIVATDPDQDAITFFLNGGNLGTDFSRTGTASTGTNLGFFADNGAYVYTAQVKDEDGNYSAPVASTLTVLNVAPTLTDFSLSSDTIYEGQSVSAGLTATDPGADWMTFFINGNPVGTDGLTYGTRSTTTSLGTFADEGTFTYTGIAQDKDGAYSNPLTKTLNVLNVAPTITQITDNLTVQTNELFNFAASAIDPGIYDLLTFDWDFNMDGLFDDFTGSSGQWSFGTPGLHSVGLRVSDGDGGYAYGSFSVDAIAPAPAPPPVKPVVLETVPEPGSVLGLLAVGTLGAGVLGKRKQGDEVGNKGLK